MSCPLIGVPLRSFQYFFFGFITHTNHCSRSSSASSIRTSYHPACLGSPLTHSSIIDTSLGSLSPAALLFSEADPHRQLLVHLCCGHAMCCALFVLEKSNSILPTDIPGTLRAGICDERPRLAPASQTEEIVDKDNHHASLCCYAIGSTSLACTS